MKTRNITVPYRRTIDSQFLRYYTTEEKELKKTIIMVDRNAKIG